MKLLAAAVAVVVLAALASAMPGQLSKRLAHHVHEHNNKAVGKPIFRSGVRVGAGVGDIGMVECQDAECKVECKTIHKIPEGKCHTPPFDHNHGMEVQCAPPTAGSLCFQWAMFNKNQSGPTTCANSTIFMVDYQECGVCRQNPHNKNYNMVTGCASAKTLQVMMDCSDPACSNCSHTYNITDKQCIVPTQQEYPYAVYYTAPTACGERILYSYYNDTLCASTPTVETSFANACFSFGNQRSHYYTCS